MIDARADDIDKLKDDEDATYLENKIKQQRKGKAPGPVAFFMWVYVKCQASIVFMWLYVKCQASIVL